MGENVLLLEKGEYGINELVEKYGNALVRYAYCRTGNYAASEDIAEDAFVALLLRAKKFPNERALKAYLFKIVTNKCKDYHRAKRYAYVPLDDIQNVLYDDKTLATIDEAYDNATLYKAMQALPEAYRQVLCLCYFDGFSPEEIAKLLHKGKKQIYNALSRARLSLSQLLSKDGNL